VADTIAYDSNCAEGIVMKASFASKFFKDRTDVVISGGNL
jgi:hypothetical protein